MARCIKSACPSVYFFFSVTFVRACVRACVRFRRDVGSNGDSEGDDHNKNNSE